MVEKETRLSESQIIQMARQEEQELAQKRALLERISALYNETLTTKEALKELIAAKGKMLVSLGATVLVEAEIVNNKTCRRGFANDAL